MERGRGAERPQPRAVIPEARRLIRMKHARAVRESDPRLGPEVRKVLSLLDTAPQPPGPLGWSAKELADISLSEPISSVGVRCLMVRSSASAAGAAGPDTPSWRSIRHDTAL